MFKISTVIPTGNSKFSCFDVTCYGNEDEVAALNIPKYVGPLKENYGFRIDMTPNAATGEVNERGIKRVAAFLKKVPSDLIEEDVRSSNSATIEEFCAHYGIDV